MNAPNRVWRYLFVPLCFAGMLSISSAAELNPAAVVYKMPDQIPWGPVNAAGGRRPDLVRGIIGARPMAFSSKAEPVRVKKTRQDNKSKVRF